MQLVNNIDKKEWNKFVGSQKQSQFLQSWEWGEFQSSAGNKIWRLAVEDNGDIVAVAILLKKTLPFGSSYWFCPRGPGVQLKIKNYELRIKILEFLFDEIEKLASQENIIFLRFEPLDEIQNTKYKIQNTINIEPAKTLILDLSKSEEEILSNMHQKTRYNIRLAEKKGVKINIASAADFSRFWRLMEQTENRDGFRLHSRNYYERMITFNPDFIKLFLAEHDGQVIAGSIVSFFGDTVTYVHGASSNEHRAVMAPYALQWQAIKIAKAQGYKYYDFFGIDENKWPGVTRFKLGFGGSIIDYPGTYDVVFQKFWYNLYKLARSIRRTI